MRRKDTHFQESVISTKRDDEGERITDKDSILFFCSCLHFLQFEFTKK